MGEDFPSCPAGCDDHGEWCWPPLSGCCDLCPAETVTDDEES